MWVKKYVESVQKSVLTNNVKSDEKRTSKSVNLGITVPLQIKRINRKLYCLLVNLAQHFKFSGYSIEFLNLQQLNSYVIQII
jgi:hypothetical protein